MRILVVLLSLLSVANAQGIAINKDSTLQGTGSSGNPLGVNTSNIQRRVSAACSSGTAIRAIAADGTTLTCQAVGDTYTAGSGLTLLTGVFAIDPTYAQRRVSGTCTSPNSGISAVAQDGTVTCTSDVIIDVTTSGTPVNDWAPTGLSTATIINVSSSTVGAQINGLSGGTEGRRIAVCNYGNTNTLTFAYQNTSSAAANRFDLTGGAAWQLPGSSNTCVHFYYTASRWRSDETYDFPFLVVHGIITMSTGSVITAGTGTPESSVTAPVGSLYLRSNGGAGTTLYVKESGAGNTGWVAK